MQFSERFCLRRSAADTSSIDESRNHVPRALELFSEDAAGARFRAGVQTLDRFSEVSQQAPRSSGTRRERAS